MRKQLSKAEIIDLINSTEYISVEVDEYKTGESRNSYFDTHDNIYDDMMENVDYLEFFTDKVGILRDSYSYNYESTLSEIFSVIRTYSLNDLVRYDEIVEEIEKVKEENDDVYITDIDDYTLSQVQISYPSLFDEVIDILNDLTDNDIDAYVDSSTIFDCTDPYEAIDSSIYEALAYWTVYFEPRYEDIDIANEVGLVPFKYQDKFYLALGGCGMDLSPKLDAYVAITIGTLPNNSLFFNEADYFKYVVGNHVYDKIIKECKREVPLYTITFNSN